MNTSKVSFSGMLFKSIYFQMSTIYRNELLRVSTAVYFVVANIKMIYGHNSLFCMVISYINPSEIMYPWSVNLI